MRLPNRSSGIIRNASQRRMIGVSPSLRIHGPRIHGPVIPPVVPHLVDVISHLSGCEKCKAEATLFISGSVWAATSAAGVSGPGAIPVAELVLAGEYGAAAAHAAVTVLFNQGVDAASEHICKSLGKC